MRRFHIELDDESATALSRLYAKAIKDSIATGKVQRPPSEVSLIRAAIVDAASRLK
jgi:hypothetical protein